MRSLCHGRVKHEDAHLQARKRVLTGVELAGTWILDFPDLQNCEK